MRENLAEVTSARQTPDSYTHTDAKTVAGQVSLLGLPDSVRPQVH